MPLRPWYIWGLRELKSSNTGTRDLKSLQYTTVKERRAERFSKQTNNVRTEKEITAPATLLDQIRWNDSESDRKKKEWKNFLDLNPPVDHKALSLMLQES